MAITTEEITKRIEESRKELLDLGLRNPLISYRYLRGKGVEATGVEAESVFDILVRRGRAISFLPSEEATQAALEFANSEDELGPSHLGAGSTVSEDEGGNLAQGRFLTRESPADLEKRLLNTYYASNTLLQEQGVNTLFIALGMVQWYESDSSDNERRAPLILVPVSLDRTSVRGRFSVRYTGEDLGENLSFIEKAREEFGVKFPGLHDRDDKDEEEIDIGAYFSKAEQAIKGLEHWSVDSASVVLGFFSFSKLLMHRDLDAQNWPDGSGPQDNKIIRALFGEGFSEPAPTIGDEDRLDDYLHPKDVHHVVDADSSQALAILDVNNGRNLVIQGPPGTGKSQTITNIIAEAIGQGKKVLFVSEKMAALEVVKRRLDYLHLGDACLELHSHKTTKRTVLNELKRAWDLGRPNIEGREDDFVTLSRIRNRLNKYAEAVNTPVGDTGLSPFDSYGEFMRLKDQLGEVVNSLPRPEIAGIDLWSRSEFSEKLNVVEDLQIRLGNVGVLRDHVFWGSQLQVVLPPQMASLRQEINASLDTLDALQDCSHALGDALGLTAPGDLTRLEVLMSTAEFTADAPDITGVKLGASEWRSRSKDIGKLRDYGVEWAKLHHRHGASLVPNAWGQDVEEIRHNLIRGGLLPRFVRPSYHEAKKKLSMLCRDELPKSIEERLELVDAIIRESRLKKSINELGSAVAPTLGLEWQGEHRDWDAVARVIDWTLELHAEIDNGRIDPGIIGSLREELHYEDISESKEQADNSLNQYRARSEGVQNCLEIDRTKRFGSPRGLAGLPFAEQLSILKDWSERLSEIQDIATINIALSAANDEGLGAISEFAVERPNATNNLSMCFELARYESILSRAFNERRELSGFVTTTHESQIERFRTMDSLVLDHNRARVASAHWEGLPSRDAPGQPRVLRTEFEKRRGHLPIRQLISNAGNAIQAIKPVFMMSPLSIATYIAPNSVTFDLVVFDEASQVKPVDALGALLRAKGVAVVGDDRQLPPTSFFDAVTHTDDDDSFDDNITADIESILGLMRSAGCPSRMLRWHYRSRHESLIATSNQEFYQNGLVVFPSPDAGKTDVGLQYHNIPDAVYDRGGSRANRKEAEEVANAVMEHAKLHPGLTLGVAAFSSAQMTAIRDRVEWLRRQDDSYESFFNAHPEEPFFIKNLENVQGDERDVIFISVGYGRDSKGQISMNFGPLNRDGGERRLNVIITRAKRRCHVFTNLRAEDINLGSNRSPGLRALKTFLAYAESGKLPSDMPVESSRDVDSPFQRAVAFRLRSRGYEVHEEVASGGKFIDLAIVDPKHPGRYILGIECDGATYHSSMSARDRDRIREQVLSGLGWQLHRIWSTDWFRNEERELERVVEATGQAKVAQSGTPPDDVGSRPEIQRSDGEEDSDGLDVPLYKLAQPRVNTRSYELSELPSSRLIAPIAEVVSVEGPVHVSEVIRRIREAAGVKRSGGRIKQNLNLAIDATVRGKRRVRRKGDFLWMAGVKNPTVRDRSEYRQLRRIDIIAPEEIAEAVKLLVEKSFSIDRQEAVRESAKLLGFRSVSENVRAGVDSIVAGLGPVHTNATHRR